MSLPPRQGLYDPQFERDNCGLGFVATLKQKPTHEVVAQALEILRNLTHRGAAGCDPCTGDGAGVLLEIPHAVYAETPLERSNDLTKIERLARLEELSRRDAHRIDDAAEPTSTKTVEQDSAVSRNTNRKLPGAVGVRRAVG